MAVSEMKKPQPFRSVLEGILKSLEIETPLRAYSILGVWKDLMGEPIALQTRPRAIRNRILFVDVSHPTWIQQLQFLKPQLIEKVNAFMGERFIEDIRFKLGKTDQTPPPSKSDAWKEEEVDKETLTRMETFLQRVEDGEIKGNLRNVLIKGVKLERHRERQK